MKRRWPEDPPHGEKARGLSPVALTHQVFGEDLGRRAGHATQASVYFLRRYFALRRQVPGLLGCVPLHLCQEPLETLARPAFPPGRFLPEPIEQGFDVPGRQ